ncbi:MAG: hypothetical protein IPH28_00940 [Cytophagaceae bacterium]|nr:hypothetical protein [Cytophagaceae bacterium]MBK9510847.1 hypothetical protein [Cytophagaceae bacterium]MBK9934671.1 hypothetical protein [Cytophagaceae bacterium]MBL0301108.1 hypothetical protein [Cytophagaceae bacterium]MBL0323926.1 hypothetical protein [Cytophagaceae bacterium]
MNKNQKRAIVVAAILSSQLATTAVYSQNSVTQRTAASTDPYIKIKIEKALQQKTTLVACLNGSPVYKSGKGELFSIDPETGDMKILNSDLYIKMSPFEKQMNIASATKQNSSRSSRKTVTFKYATGIEGIKVLGIDTDGHVVQQNANGEKFIIDPSTGDMVDYLGHVTLLK